MNLSTNIFRKLPDNLTLQDYSVVLHVVISNSNIGMLKHFLKVFNPPVYFMSTLLEHAIFCGYLEGVQLLVDYDTNINYINHLHQASATGNFSIVK